MSAAIKSVLVVDDDTADRVLFRNILGQIDPTIICLQAANARAALEILLKAETEKPDVIFLDINMPVMNGLECLSQIKSDPGNKSIPVIMFSTSSQERDISTAFNLGAECYCVKPDEPKEIIEMLRLVVENFKKDFRSLLLENKSFKCFLYPT